MEHEATERGRENEFNFTEGGFNSRNVTLIFFFFEHRNYLLFFFLFSNPNLLYFRRLGEEDECLRKSNPAHMHGNTSEASTARASSEIYGA